MTAEPKERNSLSLIKMIGYVGGGIAISILGPIIVADGTLNNYYKLIFGAMTVVLVGSITGALGVKERVAFKGDKSEKYGFKELRTFLTTKPILITFISSLIYGIGTQIQSGANAYFYTYIMGDLTLLSGVSGMAIVGMVPAMVLSPIIANKIGKKKYM